MSRDYNEIWTLGAKNGSSRRPEQTEIARVWALSGPATSNPVARQVSAAMGLDLRDNARLFALSSMAAAAAVLRAQYGDVVPRFKLSSSTAPGVVRSYERLSDYVAEVINGRICEGVRYRQSGDAGAEMGQQLGEYVAANDLRKRDAQRK